MSIVPAMDATQGSTRSAFLYPQLTTTNYTSWVIRVQAMMEDQGVLEAVEPAAGADVDANKCKKARSLLLRRVCGSQIRHYSSRAAASDPPSRTTASDPPIYVAALLSSPPAHRIGAKAAAAVQRKRDEGGGRIDRGEVGAWQRDEDDNGVGCDADLSRALDQDLRRWNYGPA
uniref:DUF4219 domain-containing protein n=1 Tax=Oryza brachyantha TaxID=4533 RepID=J3MLI5_ORYBR